MIPNYTLRDNAAALGPLNGADQIPVGWYARLSFVSDEKAADGTPLTEGMWVRVTAQAADGTYTGTLNNEPDIADLQCGDTIKFEARHVLTVQAPKVSH